MTRERFIGELERLTMMAISAGMRKDSIKLLSMAHKYECVLKERDDEAKRRRELKQTRLIRMAAKRLGIGV